MKLGLVGRKIVGKNEENIKLLMEHSFITPFVMCFFKVKLMSRSPLYL